MWGRGQHKGCECPWRTERNGRRWSAELSSSVLWGGCFMRQRETVWLTPNHEPLPYHTQPHIHQTDTLRECACKTQFTADPCSSESEFTGVIKNTSLKRRMELCTSDLPLFSPWNRSTRRRNLGPLGPADNVSCIIPHHLIHSFIGSFTGWGILEVLHMGWSFSEGRQFSVKAHWWVMPVWLIASIKL